MPTTFEFERASKIERRIEELISALVEAQINGDDLSGLQGKLDELSLELARLRTPAFATA